MIIEDGPTWNPPNRKSRRKVNEYCAKRIKEFWLDPERNGLGHAYDIEIKVTDEGIISNLVNGLPREKDRVS